MTTASQTPGEQAELDALIALARREHRAGRLAEAAEACRQILAIRPEMAETHNDLGIIFAQQGRLDQALACFEQAIALRPLYADAHVNLGNVLLNQGQLDQAAARYRQALALAPNHAQAHYNLANTLKRQGKLDQAVSRFEQAIALRPNYAAALKNLGIALRDQLKLTEAQQVFQRLLTLEPDSPEAQVALSSCYLLAGDYERGWPAYEGRLRMPELAAQPNLPRWSGEPLAGRSLLLVVEQGLGDTIQFVRYARLLKERGARVVLAVGATLGPLLARDTDLDELYIIGSGAVLPRCDYYLPLLSVPGALGTTASTIPGEVPYLSADPALTAQWRQELAGIEAFKIGIAWQGSRDYPSDHKRSIPLAHFAPLAGLTGVRLISLQKGFGSEQIAAVDFPVLDLSGRLDEEAGALMDTAAVIRNLDLVVTSDTSIPHLAGALGAAVWVALPFSPDWRWLRSGDASPWYPTMRLFRQTTIGQWPDVFERIAKAVEARRAEKA